jgi:serine/threonine-protein kinase RsbT
MMHFEYSVVGGDFSKAGNVSSNVKKVLKQLNLDPVIIKRVIIALYEAEVNIVAHAFAGKVIVDIDEEKIVIELDDVGPGIPDVPKAMEKGYSTASKLVREMGFGAGMGLHNIKTNSDKFEISSDVTKGTKLNIEVNFSSTIHGTE